MAATYDEKTHAQQLEHSNPALTKPEHITDTDGTSTPESLEAGPGFDETRTKKLLRKLDWHLVPFLALLYL